MAKLDVKKLDTEIYDLLKLAAENSDEDHTIWMDVQSIAWITLDSRRPGARRAIHQRLNYLLRQGQVERQKFGNVAGWRLAKK